MKEQSRAAHQHPIPGLTRADEEKQLATIIGTAQDNLDRAKADIRKLNDDLADLMEVYETQDKEGLALWNMQLLSLRKPSGA